MCGNSVSGRDEEPGTLVCKEIDVGNPNPLENVLFLILGLLAEKCHCRIRRVRKAERGSVRAIINAAYTYIHARIEASTPRNRSENMIFTR